jgi:hypothetical protein
VKPWVLLAIAWVLRYGLLASRRFTRKAGPFHGVLLSVAGNRVLRGLRLLRACHGVTSIGSSRH